MHAKYERLKEYLAGTEKAAVAFSGGVDSAFLLFAARDALGDRVLALTADSCFCPPREVRETADYCRALGIAHEIVKVDPLAVPGVKENPADRCYLCKKALFAELLQAAAAQGCRILAEGSNLDDMGDYRPGLKAVEELGVKSPLREIGFTKQEIRALSRELGIPVWNKPSFACLASRIPYGDEITGEKLRMVDAAEEYLMTLGFTQFRVRVHGSLARLELLPEELQRAVDLRGTITQKLKTLGFRYVALDLQGYRTGSLNEVLK